MSSKVESQRKLLVAAGIAIGILMIIIAMLLYNKFGQNKVIEQQKVEIDEANQLNKELQQEYDNAIAELDEALAENEDLREMIEEQKAELTRQKSKISKMIKSGEGNKSALNAARAELEELRNQQLGFIAKIDELEEQNQLLTNEIVQVKEEKKIVEEEVVKERTEKETVISQKDSLEGVKKELEKENEYLGNKVDIGSVIKIKDVLVEGYKLKSGGKMVKKRYAKNIDVLKICYNAMENKVTENQTESFQIRIMTPLGTTMFVENLGSGQFTNKETGETVRYTKSHDTPYSNKAIDLCVNWKPDTPFQKGIYKLEVYNKGYLSGTSEFTLK